MLTGRRIDLQGVECRTCAWSPIKRVFPLGFTGEMSRIASGDTAFSTTVVYYLALAAVSIYAFRGGNLLVAGAFCGSQLRFFIVNVST